MNLGLVGILTALQTANPNPKDSVPYDSSKTYAEEVASDLMENGQREFIQGPGEYYTRCWVKREDIKEKNEKLEYRLCKTHFQHPGQKRPNNMWFLEFTVNEPDSTTLVVADYGISGHAQICGIMLDGPAKQAYDTKECDIIYHSLIALLRTSLKKEGAYEKNSRENPMAPMGFEPTTPGSL